VKRKSTSLKPIEKRGAIGGGTGIGVWTDPKTGAGGGIGGPLYEMSWEKREYWPEGIMSSDGLLNMPMVKKMVLTDGSTGNTLEVNFARYQPPKPASS